MLERFESSQPGPPHRPRVLQGRARTIVMVISIACTLIGLGLVLLGNVGH